MSKESERIKELEAMLAESESWRETWRKQSERLDVRVCKLELRIHELIRDAEGIIELDHVKDRRKAWVNAKEKP